MQPLINIEKFISHKEIIGNLKLYPIQKQILVDFWMGEYTMAVWCLGRRSGKTLDAAISGVYGCTAYNPIYRQFIRNQEKYCVLFIANSQDQARIALEQVKTILNNSPLLKSYIEKDNATEIHLSNGAIFKSVPNSPKSIRGYPVAIAILDEAAYYASGSGKLTGEELLRAVEPSIAQFGRHGKLIMISTPWTKQGVFYENFQKGKSGDFPEIHTANYPTWEVNLGIDKTFLEQAKKRDPVLFEVEYGANFSMDFATFLDGYLIDNAIAFDSTQPPKKEYKNRYFLALDPALSGDAFTAAIGHKEKDVLVIDKYHEFVPTFNQGNKKVVDIAKVEEWILQQHKQYGFAKVVFDQYQSAGTIQRLSKHFGSKIYELTWTYKSKTEAYSHLKELFNMEMIKLIDHDKAIQQLKNLQVHYNPSGGWTVSGGSGLQVDDYCSVTAALALVAKTFKDVGWSKYA